MLSSGLFHFNGGSRIGGAQAGHDLSSQEGAQAAAIVQRKLAENGALSFQQVQRDVDCAFSDGMRCHAARLGQRFTAVNSHLGVMAFVVDLGQRIVERVPVALFKYT